MAKSKYELRLDLRSVNWCALQTDEELCREARRLLPAALEELGQAMAEAAWERQPAAACPPIEYGGAATDMRAFVVEAGRRYRRHASAKDRQALEELIVRHLRAARDLAAAGTRDGGSTIPVASPVGLPGPASSAGVGR